MAIEAKHWFVFTLPWLEANPWFASSLSENSLLWTCGSRAEILRNIAKTYHVTGSVFMRQFRFFGAHCSVFMQPLEVSDSIPVESSRLYFLVHFQERKPVRLASSFYNAITYFVIPFQKCSDFAKVL